MKHKLSKSRIKAPTEMAEGMIQKLHMDYFDVLPNSFCSRISMGGIPMGGGKMRPTTMKKGWSDMILFMMGKAIVIELKTRKEYDYLVKHYRDLEQYRIKNKKGLHLFNQINFINSVRHSGNFGFFSCSLDMTKDKLKELGVL